MPSTSVPVEEVKKNIRALLISAPRGLSVEDIEHDYRAMLGKPLPYRDFKCRNCLEFLKTLPDVVSPIWSNGSLILKGIADSSTKHIARLVARQKTSSRSRRVSKAPICTKPLIVPSFFRSNIKELLLSYPSGILGSALNSAYARNYGEEINFVKLGFKSMSHLLGNMQDIVTIVKDGKGGFRVCGTRGRRKSSIPEAKVQEVRRRPTAPHPLMQQVNSGNSASNRWKPTDLTSLENSETRKNEKNLEKSVENLLDSKSGVSEDIKEELILILTERPNGIWANRLPFEYKAKFNKALSVISLGFYSVIELASSLPEVIRIARPFPNGDWMLFLAEKSKIAKNITKIYVPDDAIGKGVCFCSQRLPDSGSIGVYVTHIKSPDCFWVQLEDYGADLKCLEEKLESFYNSKESAQFLMDDGLIKLGQVCVARFPENNLWYRALITGTPMKAQHLAEVFYVDYGNSSQVFKSDIRLMKKMFFGLPPRAIKSKLANIKPKTKETWDPSAAYRLNELTADKLLYCWVTDRKDDVLSLCICDTTSSDDIHINDLLVEEGFAVFKNCNFVNNAKTPPRESTATTAQDKVPKAPITVGPPGLPSPNSEQKIEEFNVAAMNKNTLPDYSLPLNLFPYTAYGLPTMNPSSLAAINHNLPVVNPLLSVSQPEEKPPVIDDEDTKLDSLLEGSRSKRKKYNNFISRHLQERPSAEDLEFMRQVCEELSDNEVMIVKRLDLPVDKFIHLINYQGKPHVIRAEISYLLWETDLLRSMLRKKKMVVPLEVIAREDHGELFCEFERLKVGDFGDGEDVKEYASLYELADVVNILEAFKHPSPETIKRIREEKLAFDANPASFWNNNSDFGDSNETDDSGQSESEDANLEELKLALQALQFRRKRILRSMVKGGLTAGEYAVDEVDEVEQQLEHIRELITKAEAKEKAKERGETSTKDEVKKDNSENSVLTKNDVVPAFTAENNTSEKVKHSTQNQDNAEKPVGITLPNAKCPPQVSQALKPAPQPLTQDQPVDQVQNEDSWITKLALANQDHLKNQEKHYRNVVDAAKKSIEHLSFANSRKLPPTSANFTRNGNLPQAPSQDLNPISPPFNGFPSLLGARANLPVYFGTMPQPNLFFPPNSNAPLLQFGQLHPVPPVLPDMAFPPGGPYHQQSLLGQPPVGPIYFPWNQQNTFGPFSVENVRERPGR